MLLSKDPDVDIEQFCKHTTNNDDESINNSNNSNNDNEKIQRVESGESQYLQSEKMIIDNYLIGEEKEIAFSPSSFSPKHRELTESEITFRNEYRELSKVAEKTIISCLTAGNLHPEEVENSKKHLFEILTQVQQLSNTYPFIILYPRVIKKVTNLQKEIEKAILTLKNLSQIKHIESQLKGHEEDLYTLVTLVATVENHSKANELHHKFSHLFKTLAKLHKDIDEITSEDKHRLLHELQDLQENAANLHFTLCMFSIIVIIIIVIYFRFHDLIIIIYFLLTK